MRSEQNCVHSYNSHWHTKLLNNTLVHGYDDVFPDALFKEMVKEASGGGRWLIGTFSGEISYGDFQGSHKYF